MTLLKPTLIVKRLYAKSASKVAYNEEFHEGINILSGCNGGGKTSVIQLLTYGLGYEVNNWKVEAKECNTVYVGLEINGEPLTLRRFNTDSEKQPMDICFMPFENAIKTDIENWSNYPYAISSKESFSQKLFAILGIPEAKADANNNNITIHQILRLLYNNQSNIADALFNIEPFDSAFKRESIGNYLLGLYDNEQYNARIKQIEEEKKLDKVVAKLQAIYSVIGKTTFAKELHTIDEQKHKFIDKIAQVNEDIQVLKEETIASYIDEKNETENQAVENIKAKAKLFECESELQSIEYTIEDSKEFIAELLDKSTAIKDSIIVGNSIPKIFFKVCPSCFKEIKQKDAACCHVCGEEGDDTNNNANLLRMKNEIDIQIRESERILNKKQIKYKELLELRKTLRTQLRRQITKAQATVIAVNTSTESKVFDKYREIGEIEEKITNLARMQELHESIGELTEERNAHQTEVNRLKGIVEQKKYQFTKREPEIRKTISDYLIKILRADNSAEDEFKNAHTVYFDFASNTVAINGKTSFSESGSVYLNNAFHFAIFLASIEKAYVRIPRFMILDGIENGGMEDARSQNFQKVISEMLHDCDTQHQIIFATKSISDILDRDKYVVGSKFTENNRSLKV
jgi:predicted amidophosphoribosyltransferase